MDAASDDAFAEQMALTHDNLSCSPMFSAREAAGVLGCTPQHVTDDAVVQAR